MALEIANLVHAICVASLQTSGSAFLRQNGFDGTVIRSAAGIFVLPLKEKLGFASADPLPAVVHVTPVGSPARICSGAIIPSDHDTLSAYAGDVAILMFDAAGAAADAQAVNVTVERFPTTA